MKEMSSNPVVSICIPTYNRAGMVSKAIDSVLAQSYSNIEILVVDNASDDNIEEVVSSFHDPRLKFVKNDKNLGQFGNFNRCIELAQGKYIHILHSDDWIDPEFTEACTRFLESNPDVVMTFTSLVIHTQGNQKLLTVSGKTEIYPPPEGFRQILLRRSFIGCPSVMVRREIYDTVGRFSLEYPYSADYYQWLKISRQYSIAYIIDTTLHNRQGDHTESYQLLFKTPLGYIDTIKIFVRIVDELGDDLGLYSRELNCAYRRHMRDCLFAGIARSESMIKYSSLIFIGFAVSTWGLITPISLSDKMKKFSEFLLIFLIGCAIVLPGGRYCVRKLFGFSPEKY